MYAKFAYLVISKNFSRAVEIISVDLYKNFLAHSIEGARTDFRPKK